MVRGRGGLGRTGDRSERGPARAGQRLVHLGLRSRITLSFAFGALVLSSALAAITYFTTRSQIVSQELSTVQNQAYAHALSVLNKMQAGDSSPIPISGGTLEYQAISQVDAGSGSTSLYFDGAQWTQLNPKLGEQLLPRPLVTSVTSTHRASYQVFSDGTKTEVAVGVPVPALGGDYFEIFPLDATSRTLHIILAALAVAGLVTTIAGAVLGRWAAGRALRPLRDVSQAALAIASGRLGTRLETADARDLAVLASSFNRMVDRLQQRIERDARFTSDVSHELRSPLTTLAASLSVIEARREELPDRSRQALDLVAAEVRRFQRMVGELLEISRLDAGSADFEASLVAIGELVRRSAQPAGSGVAVAVDPAVEHRQVVVDKRRFERIMTNLLENAERYAGGATRVTVEGREGSVRIAVEDEGPGIPPEERERVFERFARGSVAAGSRGTGGGTGLGLALVVEHVKLHGGRVWVEEHGERGARFVVELPLPRAEELARAESELEERSASGEDYGNTVGDDAPLPARVGERR
ncbi:MAG: periplasmic sensor signal transduction histidine kinase [Acidimicrobiaceae bacterium]|nr:periplasmic sensor signal transduction histidine kinase [Acidimicrobiaceae bacterium]